MSDTTTKLDAHSLKPGDRFVTRDVVVTVIGEQEPAKDFFDREGHIKYMCKREDTGKEGYMSFGPGAIPLEPAPTAPGKCSNCGDGAVPGCAIEANGKCKACNAIGDDWNATRQ